MELTDHKAEGMWGGFLANGLPALEQALGILRAEYLGLQLQIARPKNTATEYKHRPNLQVPFNWPASGIGPLIHQGFLRTEIVSSLRVLLIQLGQLYSAQILSDDTLNEWIAKELNVARSLLGYRFTLTVAPRSQPAQNGFRSFDFDQLFGAIAKVAPPIRKTTVRDAEEAVAKMAKEAASPSPIPIGGKDGLLLTLAYQQLVANTNPTGWDGVRSNLTYYLSPYPDSAAAGTLTLRLISGDVRPGAPLDSAETRAAGKIKDALTAALEQIVGKES